MVLGPAIAAHKSAERAEGYRLHENKLEERARAMSTEDLIREIREYEGEKAFYDGILKKILEDELGEMKHHRRNLEGLDYLALIETNYEIQNRVLGERTSSK